jgi:8-oxo-dGTP diphosphatase
MRCEKMDNEKPKKQFLIVNAIVSNDNGEILLVKRDRKWHKEAHDKWELPGGKVDFGETPEEACVRETKEESGFDVKIKKMIPETIVSYWEYPDRKSQQILLCYVCELNGGEASLEDHGVSEVKWLDIKKAKKLKCLPGTLEFLDYYLKQK